MKPYSRKDETIRVKNRSKYGAVPRKKRRNGYKVANPTGFWDIFAVSGRLILKRINKSKGQTKHNKVEIINDKI